MYEIQCNKVFVVFRLTVIAYCIAVRTQWGCHTLEGNAVTKLIRKECEKIPDKEDFLSISALKNRKMNTDSNIRNCLGPTTRLKLVHCKIYIYKRNVKNRSQT